MRPHEDIRNNKRSAHFATPCECEQHAVRDRSPWNQRQWTSTYSNFQFTILIWFRLALYSIVTCSARGRDVSHDNSAIEKVMKGHDTLLDYWEGHKVMIAQLSRREFLFVLVLLFTRSWLDLYLVVTYHVISRLLRRSWLQTLWAKQWIGEVNTMTWIPKNG